MSDEEDQEKYCVDFFRKSLEHEEAPQPQHHHETSAAETSDHLNDDDNIDLFSKKFSGPGRKSGVEMDNDEHKRFVRYNISVSFFSMLISISMMF